MLTGYVRVYRAEEGEGGNQGRRVGGFDRDGGRWRVEGCSCRITLTLLDCHECED